MDIKLSISILLVIAQLGRAVNINCTTCNSNDTPQCASDPGAVQATCIGEKCYTYLESGTTKRNCAGPTGDCTDANNCISCDGAEKCNVAIYPSDRGTCIQCDSTVDCVNLNSDVKGKVCKTYSKDHACYTYVETAQKVIRGCVADGADKCQDDNCLKCPTNDCNNIKATSESTCFECSSENNNECKRPANSGEGDCKISVTQKCKDDVLLGRKPECFINYDGEMVSRGCQSKKPPGDTEPSTGNDSNSKCIPDAVCYSCDSSKDAKCTDASGLAAFNKTCNAYTTLCHLCEKLDGKTTIRGCGLTTESDVICKTCRGVSCNNEAKLPKSCYSCDSKTDPKCTSNEGIATKFCKDNTDQCYAMLDSNGMTKRGCKSELSEDSCKENDPKCKICETHNCNTYKFVTTARQCYVCNDKEDCAKNQTEVARNPTSCAKADDLCYMYSSDDTTMRRGCLSEDGHPDACDQSGAFKCVKCQTDGCNSKALLAPNGLKCIQCKDNDSCSWGFDAKQAVSCAKSIPFYTQELCYVLDDGSGQVERGCNSDSNSCTLENSNCRFCYDDGCNTQSSKLWSCVRCRSTFGGQTTCKKENPSGFENTCLRTPTAETRGCYVYNFGGVIIRGCLSDLDEVDYANCVNEKFDGCRMCKEENCNTGKAPNSSSALYVSTALVFSSLVFIFIKY